MPNQFDYTTQARVFTLRFPLLSYVLIQVNFWVLAYFLLATVMHFSNLSVIKTHRLDVPVLYLPAVWLSIFAGAVYGTSLGLVDWWLNKRSNRKLSLGLIIVIRSVIYFLVLVAIMAFIRYVLWESILMVYFYGDTGLVLTEDTWRYIFYSAAVYSLALAPVISFINQMNKKFGPGILIPMLLGRYRNPRQQERMFMFIDMQSSTTHAENLGPEKYSSLIQDSFMDINDALLKYNGEIYQYVGDEMVLSWLRTPGLEGRICMDFFYACQKKFKERKEYYQETYGLVPRFKAGVHIGKVVAAEVGDIKREIAYHGDAINTAARIQSVCNKYGKSLLVSAAVFEMAGSPSDYVFESIGELALKGKGSATHLFGVDRNDGETQTVSANSGSL